LETFWWFKILGKRDLTSKKSLNSSRTSSFTSNFSLVFSSSFSREEIAGSPRRLTTLLSTSLEEEEFFFPLLVVGEGGWAEEGGWGEEVREDRSALFLLFLFKLMELISFKLDESTLFSPLFGSFTRVHFKYLLLFYVLFFLVLSKKHL